MKKEAYLIMTIKNEWVGMQLIDYHCRRIVEIATSADLTLLDLAICAARFKTIAQLFQDTLSRTQDEIKEKTKEEFNAIKRGDKQV